MVARNLNARLVGASAALVVAVGGGLAALLVAADANGDAARSARQAAVATATASEAEEVIAHLRRERAARARARTATALGAGCLGASIVLVLLFAAYMTRRVVMPGRRLAAAARRLAEGDLAARVPQAGDGEIRRLAESLNAMASSLEQGKRELRGRNAELEAQRAKLERALVDMADDKRRTEVSGRITRAVLEATPDAIGLFDRRARALLENGPMRAIRAALGEAGELRRPAGQRIRLPTDPAFYQTALDAAGADPDRATLDEIRIEGTGPDAPARVYQQYTAPVRDRSNTLLGRLVVLRDVTAEREADRLKDQFFALVSHELRTPLTSIVGYVDLLLEDHDGQLDEESRRFLAVVRRNARRLLRLVGDLLFVAQVEAGELTLASGSVDLAGLAAEAVEAAAPQADEKGVRLSVSADPVPPCWGDADRLAQAFDNLISNAIKFTAPGGRVCVRVLDRGDRAEVEVQDTGMGIAEADQALLFKRFFRASAATDEAVPGVGLGLTIVKAIVDAHGGRVAVDSRLGSGTTFVVSLPLNPPPPWAGSGNPGRTARITDVAS